MSFKSGTVLGSTQNNNTQPTGSFKSGSILGSVKNLQNQITPEQQAKTTAYSKQIAQKPIQYLSNLKVTEEQQKERINNMLGGNTLTNKIGGTVAAGGVKLAKGLVKAGENTIDALLTAAQSQPRMGVGFSTSIPVPQQDYEKQTGKKYEPEKSKATQFVKKDLTTAFDTASKYLDDTSYIKNDSFSGKILENIGSMIPTILGGGYASTALTSFGSGAEQALKEGSDLREATLYGIGNSAIEIGTEALTGGIPGLKGSFSLDSLVAKKLLKQEGLEAVSKSMSKAIIKAGYKMLGEGGEEALASVIQPLLRKAIYKQGETIDWEQVKKDVIESALIGGIVGGILNLPGTLTDIKGANNIQTKAKELGITPDEYVKQQKEQSETLKVFDKIKQDRKGLDIKYDTNIKENGIYIKNPDGTRTITINPNSPKAVEFVLVHELSHDLAGTQEYNDLKQTILDYDKTISGFEAARTNVENIYKQVYTDQILAQNPNVTPQELQTQLNNMIDEEATNDVLGTMLSDQNYINQLSTTKPNVFQKIYRWINDMLKRVTGKENKFLQDIKKGFETAYRQRGVAQVGTKYSVDDAKAKQLYLSKISKIRYDTRYNNRYDVDIIDNNGDLIGNFSDIDAENIKKVLNEDIANKIKNGFGSGWGDTKNIYKEDINISKPEITQEEKEIAIRSARRIFGETNNFNEAGYLTTDGSLLDFSGKKDGGPANTRNMDHREISAVGYNMMEFINQGNIRMKPEGGGFELTIKPTEKQFDMLKKYIEYMKNSGVVNLNADGEVFIDINKNDSGNYYDNASYQKGIPTNKIINDINYYFDNGKFPPKSELAQFRYSLKNKDINNKWEERLQKVYEPLGIKNKKQTVKPTQLDKAISTVVEANKSLSTKPIEQPIQQIEQPTQPIQQPTADKTVTQPTGKTKVSKFNESIQQSNIISDEAKAQLPTLTYTQEENMTDKGAMELAKQRLDENLNNEVVRLFNVEDTKASKVDIAGLFQLMNQYQNTNIESFNQVVEKLRKISYNTATSLQAYGMLKRMTPEGMVYFAQKDLQSLYEELSKNKNQKWIDKNAKKFELTESEINDIQDKMTKVQKSTNEREKKILIAKVQKIINNKIPSSVANQIKSLRRISMLFNLKTQVRNLVGNVGILPLNVIADSTFGTAIDKAIAKKTGVRTTGVTNVKEYVKGLKKGATETIQEYKEGIDTTDIKGNKFEIGKGNSFNDTTKVGKALNKVDKVLTTSLQLGDRPFFEAEFNNSLTNQMKLNNVAEPTESMIDIATQTALQRTWQDSNSYVEAVLSIRKAMNKLHIRGSKDFGLGDIIIPFAKTPANLTKAIWDYSPAGLTTSLLGDGINLRNNIKNGTVTPQMQRQFVNNMSKALSGSLLYLLAFGLKNKLNGGKDKDKDVASFLKSVMGITPYSINIGNKSYTFDFMQPTAIPFTVMADMQKNKELYKDNKLGAVINAMGTAGDRLMEQSFLQGITNIFSNAQYGGFNQAAIGVISDLPASFIPTLSKQIADTVDKNQRMIYDKNVIDSIKRATMAKIPFLSKKLPKAYNTLGKEIKKYGGDTNLFNIFVNPSNVNKPQNIKVANDIMALYKKTGDKTIFPRTAPKYIIKDKKTNYLTVEEQSKYQKQIGEYAAKNLENLFTMDAYKRSSDEQKIKAITNIYDAGQKIAKENYLQNK